MDGSARPAEEPKRLKGASALLPCASTWADVVARFRNSVALESAGTCHHGLEMEARNGGGGERHRR
jgi:hypothetical protein